MSIETLEQIVAVLVTAGLVAGNFLLFTPWRDGHDPRERLPAHNSNDQLSAKWDSAKRCNSFRDSKTSKRSALEPASACHGGHRSRSGRRPLRLPL